MSDLEWDATERRDGGDVRPRDASRDRVRGRPISAIRPIDPARLARAIATTRIDADASPEEAAAALIATYEEDSNG